MKVSIVGASGYTGGELLRLLLFHPQVEMAQVTSESHAGEYVYQQHPNLRKRTPLQFTSRDVLEPCEVLFLALPHGEAQKHIDRYLSLAPKIIDLFGGLPIERGRAVQEMVWTRSRGAAAFGLVRVWLAGSSARSDEDGDAHQRRWLQRDGLDPGAAAIGQSGLDRSRPADRRRCENRIVGRRRGGECGIASS